MNRRMIIHILGKILMVEGILMYLPVITAIIYREKLGIYYAIVATAATLLGALINFKEPKKKNMYAREGFVIVSLGWVLMSIVGSIPFVLTGEIPSIVDALFETVSGFTTTGSSILVNVEALSQASLFWRSFTHWVGGMGILVFVLAFMPISAGRSLHILKAEVPGPVVGKLVSKMKLTARYLYIIYFALTVIETILLCVAGMPIFDSLLHAFGTAGTGGFGIKSASIAYYNSAEIDGIITVFMILFGINFNLIYFAIIGKIKDAIKSEELRWYLGIIGIAAILITLNISPMYNNMLDAFRYAIFQVGSIITTTGYVTYNYETWPMFSQLIILLLMFIGACAGSTGGGIKVSRIVIFIKNAFKETKKMIHPNSIDATTFENQYVEPKLINQIHSYLVIYALIFIASMFILALQNLDFETIFSAVATCLNNIGPGLGKVGPVSNFAGLSDLSKLVLSFDMLAGRLELFPMLILFTPSVWKK